MKPWIAYGTDLPLWLLCTLPGKCPRWFDFERATFKPAQRCPVLPKVVSALSDSYESLTWIQLWLNGMKAIQCHLWRKLQAMLCKMRSTVPTPLACTGFGIRQSDLHCVAPSQKYPTSFPSFWELKTIKKKKHFTKKNYRKIFHIICLREKSGALDLPPHPKKQSLPPGWHINVFRLGNPYN